MNYLRSVLGTQVLGQFHYSIMPTFNEIIKCKPSVVNWRGKKGMRRNRLLCFCKLEPVIMVCRHTFTKILCRPVCVFVCFCYVMFCFCFCLFNSKIGSNLSLRNWQFLRWEKKKKKKKKNPSIFGEVGQFQGFTHPSFMKYWIFFFNICHLNLAIVEQLFNHNSSVPHPKTAKILSTQEVHHTR